MFPELLNTDDLIDTVKVGDDVQADLRTLVLQGCHTRFFLVVSMNLSLFSRLRIDINKKDAMF